MLNKQTIKDSVAAAFEAVMNQRDDQRQAAIDVVSDHLADTIIEAIKSMQITYVSGLTSATGGVVSGKFEYTIK